jgi:hypothetical protein
MSQENRSGRRPAVHHTQSATGTLTPYARSVISDAVGSGCESPFPVNPLEPILQIRSQSYDHCIYDYNTRVARFFGPNIPKREEYTAKKWRFYQKPML